MDRLWNGLGSLVWLRRCGCVALGAVCLMLAAPANAQISVTILSGSLPPHATAGDLPDVRVQVISDEEIASVSAEAGAGPVALVYEEGWAQWHGSVPVGGERGSKTLTVTAVSVSGAVGAASGFFYYSPNPPNDPPPSANGLTVLAPQPGDVARPTIEVWATYQGSAHLLVSYVPAPRQTWNPGLDRILLDNACCGTGALQGVIDLSAFDPSSGNLVFVASDGFGDIARIWVPIEVRSAPDVVDAGTGSDAGSSLDAGPTDAGGADDAAADAHTADAEGPDAAMPDAGETQDAGGCSVDGGAANGCEPDAGSHPHQPGWWWWRRLPHCSASPQAPGDPVEWPGALAGLVMLVAIVRSRRGPRT